MEMEMIVKIGKGLEIDVEQNKFNTEVTNHVIYIGLKNILQDSHANVTESTVPKNVNGHQLNDAEYVAEIKRQSLAVAHKKLQAMYNGEIRVQTEKTRLNAVESEARRMALSKIQDAIRSSGKKLKDYSNDQYAKLVDANFNKYMKAAQQVVDMRAKNNVEVDLADLGL